MRALRPAALAALLSLSVLSPFHAHAEDKPAPSTAQPAVCEHGVKQTLCTRCSPKLAAVFKAKGDWCAEHDRPESQCALCHPELERQGIRP